MWWAISLSCCQVLKVTHMTCSYRQWYVNSYLDKLFRPPELTAMSA